MRGVAVANEVSVIGCGTANIINGTVKPELSPIVIVEGRVIGLFYIIIIIARPANEYRRRVCAVICRLVRRYAFVVAVDRDVNV